MSSKKITWVPETEAAAMINYSPRTLREYAKYGKIPVNYTTINGRKYQYSKEDIEKILLEHSTVLQ